MKSKLFFYLFLVFFLTFSGLVAQQEDHLIGILSDSKTRDPIAFATIQVKGKAIGVISNSDGSFRIPKRFGTLGNSLLISCMGYQQKSVTVSALSQNSINRIVLKPAMFKLRETVVSARRKRQPSPRQIVKRAIDRIPENYPHELFSVVGYYRDYQLKNNAYINLNEAILQIVDAGFQYDDFTNTVVRLYDYRKNMQFERDSFASGSYDYASRNKIIENAFLDGFGGNEFNILRMHDALRNHNIRTYSFVDRLNKDFLRNHSFFREPDVEFKGEPMYVLRVDRGRPIPNPNGISNNMVYPDFVAKGRLYIAQATYAIHRFTYELYDYVPKEKESKKGTANNGKLMFEVAVEYTEKDDMMYPNYISFHNQFKFQKKPFKVDSIHFDPELACFVVKFNKIPEYLSVRSKGNYQVEYKGKKLKLRLIKVFGDTVYLYVNRIAYDNISDEVMATYIENGKISFEDFYFSFGYIKDDLGNYVNNFIYEDVNQFREFFTQEIRFDLPRPIKESVMDKYRPIFKDQPMVRPYNFDDYWMNTPLRSVKDTIK